MILFSSSNLSRHNDEDEEEAEDTGIPDDLLEELEEEDLEDELGLTEDVPFVPGEEDEDEDEDEDEHGLDDDFLGGDTALDEDEEDMDYDSFDDHDEL